MAWPEVHDGRYHNPLAKDQEQNSENNNRTAIYGTSTDQDMAQTFKPAVTKEITAVDVKLDRNGSPVGNVWAEIYTATAGNPPVPDQIIEFGYIGEQKAVSSKIRASEVSTTKSVYRFYFPKGILLTSGTTYAVVFKASYSLSTTNCVRWYYQSGTNPYINGRRCWYDTDSGQWVTALNDDWWFRTFYGETNVHFANMSAITDVRYASAYGDFYLAVGDWRELLAITLVIPAGETWEVLVTGMASYYQPDNGTCYLRLYDSTTGSMDMLLQNDATYARAGGVTMKFTYSTGTKTIKLEILRFGSDVILTQVRREMTIITSKVA